jgi:hypothetical protein
MLICASAEYWRHKLYVGIDSFQHFFRQEAQSTASSVRHLGQQSINCDLRRRTHKPNRYRQLTPVPG